MNLANWLRASRGDEAMCAGRAAAAAAVLLRSEGERRERRRATEAMVTMGWVGSERSEGAERKADSGRLDETLIPFFRITLLFRSEVRSGSPGIGSSLEIQWCNCCIPHSKKKNENCHQQYASS